MGSFSGGSSTLARAIDSLRQDFGPDSYNVLTRNCNTFSSALCEELLGKPIPGYVNRLAWMGERGGGGEGGGGREREGIQKRVRMVCCGVVVLKTSAVRRHSGTVAVRRFLFRFVFFFLDIPGRPFFRSQTFCRLSSKVLGSLA